MSTLTPIAATVRGSYRPLGADPRMVGKSSESAQLHGERRDHPQDPPRQRPRLQVELVCQGETNRHDPFWDGPRLTPHFVTQLLGQVMAGERHHIVRGAYGETGAAAAGLLDTRL